MPAQGIANFYRNYDFSTIGFTPLVDVVKEEYGRLGFSVPADIADNDTFYVAVELDSIKNSENYSVFKEGVFSQPYETMTAEQRAKLDMQSATKATIDKNVTIITRDTLRNYPRLERLYIPESVKSIDSDSFTDCSFLQTVYYEGNDKDFLKKVILHEGVNITYDTGSIEFKSGRCEKFKLSCKITPKQLKNPNEWTVIK